jgi:hypothetical protein
MVRGSKHGLYWLATAGTLAMVCIGPASPRADNESDRKRYLSDIEGKLYSAAGELSGFESDSDAGDLDDVRGYLREASALIDQLASVKEDDATAKDVVANYPRHIEAWNQASVSLRLLKDKQALAPGYLTSCKAWDAAMQERARTSKDDPRSHEELSAFAKSVGRQGQDLLAEAGRIRSQLEPAASVVASFSIDVNNWVRVRDAARYSATQIWQGWDRNFNEATRACEEVIKGERHRDIEQALGRLANNKTGRLELRGKLAEMLGVIAERVKDVHSQSSASNVSGAIEVTREVASLLDRLRTAQGDDDEARKIAADWPTWNTELRAALEGLLAMKQRQDVIDHAEAKCSEAERTLQELIKAILATPTRHQDGVSEIERAATQLGNDYRPRMEAALQTDKEMNEGFTRVKRFGYTDGPWGPVRDRMFRSADDVLAYWNAKYRAAKEHCTPLSLGLYNLDAKAAIAQLGRDVSSTGERSRAFYAEIKAWEAEIDKLRDWTAKDVEDIRAAFCAAPDAGDYDEVNAVADRWANQLRSQYGTITGRAEQLKQSADALIARGRSRDRMEKVKQRITETMASLDKVKAYQLEGSNNPLLKAQASYGVTAHTNKQSGCDAKEITISGDYCRNPNPKRNDCRLDCMKGCTVVEIKPDSQEPLGYRQADAYQKGLEKMFAALGSNMFNEREMKYFRQCMSSDGKSLELRQHVETYDFCNGITADKIVAAVPSVNVSSEVAE